MNQRIVIIDDEVDFSNSLKKNLTECEYNVDVLNTYDQVKSFIFTQDCTVLVDLRFGQKSGLEIISLVKSAAPASYVIMMTGFGTISTAVEAMKLGANDYLTKPFRLKQLLSVLKHEVKDTSSEHEELGTDMSLDRVEREYIEFILAQEGGNITKAAKRLGLHRQSLQRKLKKYVPNK